MAAFKSHHKSQVINYISSIRSHCGPTLRVLAFFPHSFHRPRTSAFNYNLHWNLCVHSVRRLSSKSTKSMHIYIFQLSVVYIFGVLLKAKATFCCHRTSYVPVGSCCCSLIRTPFVRLVWPHEEKKRTK